MYYMYFTCTVHVPVYTMYMYMYMKYMYMGIAHYMCVAKVVVEEERKP